jgi:hypothetical protein
MTDGDSMIIRVAQAIARAQNEADWRNCVEAARAAIQAMREPTPEMLDDATAGLPDWGYLPDEWQTMIDHALSEQVTGDEDPTKSPKAPWDPSPTRPADSRRR